MSPLMGASTVDMLTQKTLHGAGSYLADKKNSLFIPLS